MTIRQTFALASCGLFCLISACAGPERATHVDSRQPGIDANERLEQGSGGRRSDYADPDSDRDSGGSRDERGAPGGAGAPGESGGERFVADPDSHGAAGAGAGGSGAGRALDWKAAADSVVDQLVANRDQIRGPVLVFPPFGKTTARNRYNGCEIGDDIANRIVSELQARDMEAVSDSDLRERIGIVNAGLSQLPNDQDPSNAVQVLAGRIADYFAAGAVVFGTVEQRNGRGLPARKSIRLELSTRLFGRSGSRLAGVDTRWNEGESGYEDVAEGLVAGSWQIGEHAKPQFVPKVDRELELLVAKGLGDLIDQDGPDESDRDRLFLGQRVLVMPFEVAGVDHGSDGRKLMIDIAERVRRLEESLAAEGKPVSRSAVLDMELGRPIQIGTRQCPTIGQALEAQHALQLQQSRSDSGVIARTYEARISDILSRLGRGEIEVVRLDNRDMVLAQILADSFDAQGPQNVNRDSIVFSQANAPNVLLRVALNRGFDTWSLRVTAVEMRNPNRQRSTEFPLDDGWLLDGLRRAFGR